MGSTKAQAIEFALKSIPGVRLDGIDPEEIYEHLMALDECTPEAILQAASDPASPIHRCFDWDDSEAAHLWRLSQARKIAQSIRVVVRRKDASSGKVQKVAVRALVSVAAQGEGRRYESVLIMPRKRQAVLVAEAKRSLDKWRERFASVVSDVAVTFVETDEEDGDED